MPNEPFLSASSPPMPEIPGYRLDSVLGRGSTGTVYRATQLAVDREVAIKVLHPELAGSKAVRRLQREARTTARLAHPGIVSAIDMGQVGGLWWYAMELVDGSSLSSLLRDKGSLSEREALRLFIPLCEALVHAHEHGVVHRDIKPANILVDTHGRARLVDLGLALTEDDPLLTRTGGTLGTPHYLSPEQARNPQAVDSRSDIWSLGATMFHAMCGRPPFNGESVAEILSGVLYAHIPDPRQLEPKLSPGMGLVLRKCLTRSTDRRYATPSDLLRDLEALRERRAVRVSARGLDPVAGERERRRRLLWIAAGVVAVCGVAAVLVWQPWEADVTEDPAITQQELRWEPLDAVLARAAVNERQALGAALADIDELKSRVPDVHVKSYWAARSSIQDRFDAAVAKELRLVLQEFEKAITHERNFVRAAALVAPGVEERLASEFAANEDQRKAVLRKLNFAAQREQVVADEKLALDSFMKLLNAYYDEFVLPKVGNAQKAGAWRDARDWIQRDVREVIEEAGLSVRGLTPAKVEEKIAYVSLLKIKSQKDAIERAWQEKDAEIEKAVVARQSEIEAQLRGRELRGDAVAAIDAAFEAELKRHGIERKQMLSEVAQRSDDALAAARGALEKLQEQLSIEDARTDLAAMDRQLEPAWKERRYAEIASIWEARLAEEWLRPVHAEVELRMGEARLLQGLLERAAQGLKTPGLDSILVKTIELHGKIEAGSDPLNDGFRFTFAGKSQVHAFHSAKDPILLGPEGVERLAGLAEDPKDELQSVDRLVRSLFRWREGDADTALKVFQSGPLPTEGHAQIVAELERRLNQAHEALTAQSLQREKEAEGLYNVVLREGLHKRDAEDRIKRIKDLLTQYGDTAFVRGKDAELRALRTQLVAPSGVSLAEQLQGFGPTKISYPSSSTVLLEYVFTEDASAGWSLGNWRRHPDGWSASREHSLKELSDETLWPRLILERPLDLDASMEVTLEFEQTKESGPPRYFIASVAGAHVGFAGVGDGTKGQVAVSSGGVEAVSTLIETLVSKQGLPVAGLQRGKRHVLHLKLEQGRGKLEARLDGELLLTQNVLRPEGKGGSYSIVVRSLEPVLLKAVRIEAGLQNK